MSKYKNFLRYQGSKDKYLDELLATCKHINVDRYVEPFIGSGALYINLPNKFDEYIINDLNEHVISIWKSIKNFTYQDFIDSKEFIISKFGDIKSEKSSYYDFRNWYNDEYHFTDKIEKGLYLYHLANSCINSMLRFGPNGMNQSFGNRWYFLDKSSYNEIRLKMSKTIILNTDYHKVLKDVNESLLFLDPPYFERKTSYTSNFDITDFEQFIDNLISYSKRNFVLYTDTEHEYLQDFNSIKLRTMKNTAPSSKKENTINEMLYYNFEIPNDILLDW